MQFVFELELPWATVDTLDQLEGNYGDLSMQKYSSNVVERCLKYAGEERCARIIKELMSNSRLDQIMQDPYGNYVIQAALNHSKVEFFKHIRKILTANEFQIFSEVYISSFIRTTICDLLLSFGFPLQELSLDIYS